jgi:hypothetical protein
MFIHACNNCAETFTTDRSNSKYCTIACRGIARRTQQILECQQCGTSFSRHLSSIDKSGGSYCSRPCYDKGRAGFNPNIHFWPKVVIGEPNACWIWTGCIGTRGYGKASIDKKTKLAHRVSYELTHGQIPKNKQINHTCDVRACVNPAHLYPGSSKQNTKDMIDRDRGNLFQSGAQHHAAKLTSDDVISIRASKETPKELAVKFGIIEDSITRILRRERWKHI